MIAFVNHQCRHASQFSANTAKRPGEGGPLPPLIHPTRNGPYDFPIHNPLRNAPRGSDLARANLQLGRLVDQRKTTEVFETCLKMKAAGTKPNLVTYDQLLRVCADHRATTEAWAVFEDMLCMGIRPERESFHHVIIVRSIHLLLSPSGFLTLLLSTGFLFSRDEGNLEDSRYDGNIRHFT